jgi:hypothetical protein
MRNVRIQKMIRINGQNVRNRILRMECLANPRNMINLNMMKLML